MKDLTIREARESMGITQQDMADKLGISRQAYTYIENNPEGIKVSRAREICRILGAEYERILFIQLAN